MAAVADRSCRLMWSVDNRTRYGRDKLRYPTDLTDAEWEWAKAEIPHARLGGNKRTVVVREVMNGLMYVLDTGCQWRTIPKDLPPPRT
ncbi:MAG: transposase, partial [Oxalobacteraceae bacterium]